MLRKLNIIIFFVITLSCLLKSQIIEPLYDYGSSRLSSSKYYFGEGLLKKSEQELTKAMMKFSETVNKDEVVLLQSMIDQSYGNNKISEVSLYRFIRENPNSPIISFAAMQRAYLAFEHKNYDLAEKLFGESKKIADSEYQKRLNPVFKEFSNNALYWRGVSLSQRGKYQEAQQYFEECYRNYPKGKFADDALFALGMGAEVNRHFDAALTYYRTLQKSYPYSNSFIASRVREINDDLILRDPVSALVTIESTDQILKRIQSGDSLGLQYEPQSFSEQASEEIMYLKGEAYNLSGNYEQSASFFRGFLETFTQSDLINYVRLGYAWALLNKGQFEESINTYNTIIETEKLEDSRVKALAQLYKAISLKKMGDLEQARKELSNLSVESGFPFLSQVLLELGQIYYETGEYDKAAKTLDRAERDANEALVQVRIQILSGAAYLELKKWDKAIIAYKTAEQIALKSNYIFMPQKDFYLSQARLKLGIAYIRN